MDRSYKFDVLAVGELLIDFTPIKTQSDKPCYEQNPGGAPPNVLAMVSQLGGKPAFIGKVGKDGFGSYLVNILNEFNIDTSGVAYSKDVTTTLAFVHLDQNGERSFSFCRKPGADMLLKEDELDLQLIESCNIFHFGSLSFTDDPCKTAVIKAIEHAQQINKVISYDPNYRPLLWNSEEEAIAGMRLGLKYAEIVKLSEEEAFLLTGEHDYDKAAQSLLQQGVRIVLITLGEKGSYCANKNACALVDGFNVECIDTTGAGDAFMGSVLFQLAKMDVALDELHKDDLVNILKYANGCAALCVGKRGGIPSMPTIEEVDNFIRKTNFEIKL